jgi:LmbE family N-acetylglucosaminyl deacetylase
MYTDTQLLVHLDSLRERMAEADRHSRIVEVRTFELRIAEATRALAIINRRATEALDQQQDAQPALTANEVRQVVMGLDLTKEEREAAKYIRGQCALTLVKSGTHPSHRPLCEAGIALVDRLLAMEPQPAANPALREADIREAYVAGVERAMGAAFLDQRGIDVGAQIFGPTPGDVERWAAEYARSKAGA